MKLSVLVTIAFCIHNVFCAPATPAIDSTNEEINVTELIRASGSIDNDNTNLLKSLKHLLDQTVQIPATKKIQKAPAQQNLGPDQNTFNLFSTVLQIQVRLREAEEKKNEKLTKNIEQLQSELDKCNGKTSSGSSGYVLPGGQNQQVIPNGNGPIVIEIVEQQPTNPDTYIQPLFSNAVTKQSHLGANAFRSYNFVRRH